MKMKIFTQSKEKEIYFELRYGRTGVDLCIVDTNGILSAMVLSILDTGYLHKYAGLEKNIGLQLNDNAEIKEDSG
jgi:hypothetical protein